MNHMDSAPVDREIEVFGTAIERRPHSGAPKWHRVKFRRDTNGDPEWGISDSSDYVRWPQEWRELENVE